MGSKMMIRSENLRLKLLRVMGDGDPHKLKYAVFHLNRLVEAEAVCDWLIARGYTGKNLEGWIGEKFGGLFLPMYDYVRAKVCIQNIGRPVRLGKDIV